MWDVINMLCHVDDNVSWLKKTFNDFFINSIAQSYPSNGNIHLKNKIFNNIQETYKRTEK